MVANLSSDKGGVVDVSSVIPTCISNEPILPSEKVTPRSLWSIYDVFLKNSELSKGFVFQGAQQLRFFLHATALLGISAVTAVAMAAEGKDDATVERTDGRRRVVVGLLLMCGRETHHGLFIW